MVNSANAWRAMATTGALALMPACSGESSNDGAAGVDTAATGSMTTSMGDVTTGGDSGNTTGSMTTGTATTSGNSTDSTSMTGSDTTTAMTGATGDSSTGMGDVDTMGGGGDSAMNTDLDNTGGAGSTSDDMTDIAGDGGAASDDMTSMGGAGDEVMDEGDAGAAAGGGSGGSWDPEFESLELDTDFIAEGAAVADIDGDGELDLVAGPVWYRGPSFELGGEIDDAPGVNPTAYSLYFLTFIDDVNGDGLPDLLAVGDAGGGNGTGNPNAWWYEHPGFDNVDGTWAKHTLFDGLVANESPGLYDLVGDSAKELLFMTDGRLGYAQPGADPTEPWDFTPISGDLFNTPYVHGLGVGDVDGDGLQDVIEASGWWRQLPNGGGWEQNEADFTEGVAFRIEGGAQMYSFDVNGDGLNDVITSLSGHGYGLSWFEQTESGEFAAHGILSPTEDDGNVSQLHAVNIGDMNGDGLMDIITGKRYYAHSSGDPGVEGASLLYWFELQRDGDQATFEPRLIHDDSGVGCVFAVTDVDGNGRPDVFTSSKKGTFLHRQ